MEENGKHSTIPLLLAAHIVRNELEFVVCSQFIKLLLNFRPGSQKCV